MSSNLNIIKDSPIRLPLKEIKKIFKDIKTTRDINLVFIDDKKAKILNKKYRGKNYPANILTFNFDDYSEIYISTKQIEKNAIDHKNTKKNEILFLFIHGLLHTKDIKHGRKMEKMEDDYAKKYNIIY